MNTSPAGEETYTPCALVTRGERGTVVDRNLPTLYRQIGEAHREHRRNQALCERSERRLNELLDEAVSISPSGP